MSRAGSNPPDTPVVGWLPGRMRYPAGAMHVQAPDQGPQRPANRAVGYNPRDVSTRALHCGLMLCGCAPARRKQPRLHFSLLLCGLQPARRKQPRSSPGRHLVVTWLSPGRHLLVTWSSPGCHLVVTWLSPGQPGCHLVVTWLYLVILLLITWLSPACHLVITWLSPGRHLLTPRDARIRNTH